jgi:hypothetical protein
VTTLFGEAPDLLEDFKQFLPESAAQARAQQAAIHNDEAAMMGNARADTAYNQGPSHQQTPRADTSRLPPMGNFAPTPTANRDNKRKRGERQIAGATAAAMPAQMNQEAPMSNVRGNYAQGNGNKVCPNFGDSLNLRSALYFHHAFLVQTLTSTARQNRPRKAEHRPRRPPGIPNLDPSAARADASYHDYKPEWR